MTTRNTLPKTVTRTFFDSEEGFNTFDATFRRLASSKVSLQPEHFLIAQVLRGKDYRKGFQTPTNLNKLLNGGLYSSGKFVVTKLLASTSDKFLQTHIVDRFEGTVTVGGLRKALALLPQPSWLTNVPAYSVPEDVTITITTQEKVPVLVRRKNDTVG